MLEKLFSIGLCIVSVAIYYCTTQFNLSFIGTTGVGPAFFPKIICIVLFVLSCILFVSNSRKNESCIEVKNTKYTLLVMVICVLYIFIIDKIGYLVSTILFAFVVITLLKNTSIKIKLSFSIIFPICLYLLFTYIFKVSLPEGILI